MYRKIFKGYQYWYKFFHDFKIAGIITVTFEDVNVLGDYREMTKSKNNLLNVVSTDTSLEPKSPKPQNTNPKKPHSSGMLSAETPSK